MFREVKNKPNFGKQQHQIVLKSYSILKVGANETVNSRFIVKNKLKIRINALLKKYEFFTSFAEHKISI